MPSTLEKCWAFFSDARNLPKITPPQLDFQIISDLPEQVYEGLMIEYRVRPLLGIQMTWLTEITRVRGPHYFVDEQRVGPYHIWHHEHWFREVAPGQIEIRDLVHYVLPFEPIASIFHDLMVQPQLDEIFNYRGAVIPKFFPSSQ